MKGKIAEAIAVIATGSVLSLAGAGVAAASAIDSASDRITGSSSSVNVADQITHVMDKLNQAAEAADVSKVTALIDNARETTGSIVAGERGQMNDEIMSLAADSVAEADQADMTLAKNQGRSFPDPVAMLKSVIQSLLAVLTSLVDAILGAAPSLPAPPVPLPDPGLPAPPLP